MAALPPNPTLEPLTPLIGEWRVEVPQFGAGSAPVTIEWHEGRAFVRVRSEPPDPAPDSLQLISGDDASGAYTVLYYDVRGVSRVYRMTFENGVWRQWRDAPGFAQRFSGTLSDDGRTIRAAWEKSLDNATWEHDFDLIYTRVG